MVRVLLEIPINKEQKTKQVVENNRLLMNFNQCDFILQLKMTFLAFT